MHPLFYRQTITATGGKMKHGQRMGAEANNLWFLHGRMPAALDGKDYSN